MMRRIVAVVALAAGGLLARQAPVAQTPPELTAEDSVELRIAVLRVMLDSLARGRNVDRIWIRPYSERDPATGQIREVSPTPAEWAAIARVFPGARLVETSETLYLCPPGVQVRMPGSGCPIREDGVIVRFAPLRVDGDSLRTGGTLIQSDVGSRRAYTWAQGADLAFGRIGRTWQFRGLRGLWMT